MDPAMLKSRAELSDQLQWLEDRVGEEHEAKLAGIRADYTTGRISTEEAWKQTKQIQEEARKYQRETNQISSLITSDSDSDSTPPAIQVAISPTRWSQELTFYRPYSYQSPSWLWFAYSTGDTIKVGAIMKQAGTLTRLVRNSSSSDLVLTPS